MTDFKHPPTPPAIPCQTVPVRRVEHTLSAYYEDVPGAPALAEETALADLLTAVRERYGPAAAEDARGRRTAIHRGPAWPGDMARVWVTVEVWEHGAAQ